MGPVATKVMKGYSEDDMRIVDDIKVNIKFIFEFCFKYVSNPIKKKLIDFRDCNQETEVHPEMHHQFHSM